MYIRGLLSRNSTELAEAVPIENAVFFSSGYALFAKAKLSSGIEEHLNLEVLTLDLLVCKFKVNCIKPDGRVH